MQDFFDKRIEKATFHLPGTQTETSCAVEIRLDPLTGRTSVICENLLRKFAILYGETDTDLIDALAEDSRRGCIFCPPLVYEVTPMYPVPLCDEGRLRTDATILFPNLFPTAGLHSVLTWPEHHFLRPDQFTADLLSDLFGLAGKFAQNVRKFQSEINFLSLNCNYMPPAGASVIHPHFQLIGNHQAPHRLAEITRAAAAWYSTHRSSYWDTLCTAEKDAGLRCIAEQDGWCWLTSWSPIGANEIIGIHRSAPTPFDLFPDDWAGLAAGVSRVLRYYHSRSFSSFNICLSGGSAGEPEGQRCVIRIISRQNVKPNYRNDEYYLQKFHGVELIVQAPEDMAAELRPHFS